ncbi:DUF4870 domain-containing protein [Methanolobus halotolerans]|uniref:Chloroplast import component protein (Tic20) n=1 Tax=Methanolobus halotolerans TaxID=2052935 RepID=A0A4E0QS24_9EURY|nr:hypothetical protein [Methanolobus halotolerans]TGC09658.1 hypothetical protein CUN85_04645 [Methanolobus halotolerans]
MAYDTKLGLDENIVAALCYVGFWITGILILLIEQDNKFVRFHAMQSVMVFLPLSLIVLLVAWIPYVGWIIADFMGFPSMFLVLLLAFLAYRGMKFKLPLIGTYAYRLIYK